MPQQSKIDIETQAGALLRAIVTGVDSGKHYPDEVIRWLEKHEYIYQVGYNYSATMEGREYYAGLCKNPHTNRSPNAWKDEARSGLAIKTGKLGLVSRETDIQRAAVPTCGAPRETKTPEDLIAEEQGKVNSKNKFMARWKLTPEQLDRYMDEDRIRRCNSCDEDVAVFDKDGKYFQGACRECKKAKRK